MNIPTVLTIGRIAVVPAIAVLMWMPPSMLSLQAAQGLATALFVLAAVTDWLDGYLARRLNQCSPFGAFLDPVADKVLVCTCLVMLVEIGRLWSAIAIVIICREIAVSALREWMAQIGNSKVVAVATVGKIKTTVQLIGIPFMMCDIKIAQLSTVAIGGVLLWAAAAMSVWSMWVYGKAAASGIRGGAKVGVGRIGSTAAEA